VIIEYTKEIREKMAAVLMWYLYSYRYVNTTGNPSPERIRALQLECRKLYSQENSELREVTHAILTNIDDLFLPNKGKG